jgi:hypothetical protein
MTARFQLEAMASFSTRTGFSWAPASAPVAREVDPCNNALAKTNAKLAADHLSL